MAFNLKDTQRLFAQLRRHARSQHASTDAATQSREKAFEKFLLSEYEHIAHAHFNTVVSLANFFKHYIAIASLPIVAAGIAVNLEFGKKAGILAFLTLHPILPLLLFGTVSFIGLLVLVYVINVRCDAILYARTVNGIRKYFYGRSSLPIDKQLEVRVLPTSTSLPRYLELPFFGPVVMTFTVVGTIYFSIGMYLYIGVEDTSATVSFWVAVLSFFSLHLLSYRAITNYREFGYLRSHSIGVDIDGVLNSHRQHFADVLRDKMHKVIEPDSITRIPVHEMPGTNVTEKDEQGVFNWPGYWTNMPLIQPDVGSLLAKLRNSLGYRVWIFSRRGWPQESRFPLGAEGEYWCAWINASFWSILHRPAFVRKLDSWLDLLHLPVIARGRAINALTSQWLNKHQIPYDKLVIERANSDTRDLRTLKWNRFGIAKKQTFRAFIEDDLPNARKLADSCEIVFLINQPYNHCDLEDLPSNVLRVNSWKDIYRTMREMF